MKTGLMYSILRQDCLWTQEKLGSGHNPKVKYFIDFSKWLTSIQTHSLRMESTPCAISSDKKYSFLIPKIFFFFFVFLFLFFYFFAFLILYSLAYFLDKVSFSSNQQIITIPSIQKCGSSSNSQLLYSVNVFVNQQGYFGLSEEPRP